MNAPVIQSVAEPPERHADRGMSTRSEVNFAGIIGHVARGLLSGVLTDKVKAAFGDISVELDAIRPDRLRDLVERAIQRHLPPEQFNVLKAAEASERQLINGLVGMIAGEASGG
jgi:hypothetical protein